MILYLNWKGVGVNSDRVERPRNYDGELNKFYEMGVWGVEFYEMVGVLTGVEWTRKYYMCQGWHVF